MSTDQHHTPTDLYRQAEARHGDVALQTTSGSGAEKRYWTPVYEILPERWVSYDVNTGESCIVRPVTVEMTVGAPESRVELVDWAQTPFGDTDE
jgi:hypothetical protein